MGRTDSINSIVCALSGIVFGFALDRAKTNVSFVISEQMHMRNFTMMRMFLAASATSTAVVMMLDIVGLKIREPKAGIRLGFGKLGGYGANLVGGFILGVGMFLTGSCPGTIWAQIGAGFSSPGLIFAGGILGTILFGYFEKIFREAQPKFHTLKKRSDSDLVPETYSYYLASGIFIIGIVIFIKLLDQIFPWRMELQNVLAVPVSDVQVNKMNSIIWDPMFAGVLLGLLQIPIQLTTAGALGQSSGWVYIASHIAGNFDSNLKENAPYLKQFQSSQKALLQLYMAVGIICGAFASQYLSDYPKLTLQQAPIHPLFVFLGGGLLLFGARLGGGCTSGHGLSGMATLSIASLISVIGMFSGGMLTALFFR